MNSSFFLFYERLICNVPLLPCSPVSLFPCSLVPLFPRYPVSQWICGIVPLFISESEIFHSDEETPWLSKWPWYLHLVSFRTLLISIFHPLSSLSLKYQRLSGAWKILRWDAVIVSCDHSVTERDKREGWERLNCHYLENCNKRAEEKLRKNCQNAEVHAKRKYKLTGSSCRISN